MTRVSLSLNVHLPELNKLTLGLHKATRFTANPSELLDKSLKEQHFPFLGAHANSIITFSFSTPEDDPQIGDTCFLNLPDFPYFETLSVHLSSDSFSTLENSPRFLHRRSTKLKRLEIIFVPRKLPEEREINSAPSFPSQYWQGHVFWLIPMPALTEFQLWTDKSDHLNAHEELSLGRQLPMSIGMLERLLLIGPLHGRHPETSTNLSAYSSPQMVHSS